MSVRDVKSRGDSVKKKVIECASSMFESRGVKDVKMDEIAVALSMSKRTIYELFTDKESLLLESMKYHQEIKNREIKKILKSTSNVLEVILLMYAYSIQELHKTNMKFFLDVKQYPKVVAFINNRNKKELKEAVSFFRQGVDQGIFRSDIHFDIFVMILHKQLDSLLHEGMNNRFSFFDVYEFIMFTFLRGISTRKGQDIIEDFIINFKKKSGDLSKIFA